MLEGFELTQEEINLMQNNSVPEESETPVAPVPEQPAIASEPPAHAEEQQKMVPLKALQESRAEARAIEARLAEVERRAAIAEQLKAQIDEMRAKNVPAEPAKPPMPDFDDDPIEHIRVKTEMQERELQRLQEEARTRSEMEAQWSEQQKFIQAVGATEREFAQVTPDYQSAVDYLKDFRTRELAMYGITDALAIQQEIANNAFQMAQNALRAGKNPAEFIYGLAKQYGYAPKSPEIPVPPATPAADKLATIAQGQQMASKSLATGGQTTGQVSAESLLELDGKEFEQAWLKLFGE